MRPVVEVPAIPTKVLSAAKGRVHRGGVGERVVVALGDDVTRAEYFALTITDARRLRRLLGEALQDPAPVEGAPVVPFPFSGPRGL
jgi:hypothetical protein